MFIFNMWNSSGADRIQSDPHLSPFRAVALLSDHHLHELLEVEAAVIVFVRLNVQFISTISIIRDVSTKSFLVILLMHIAEPTN